MYKLIATDLDETLLDSDKKVSQVTVDILRRLSEKGVHIAIASGRIVRTGKLIASSFCDKVSCVAYNGSVVVFEDGTSHETMLPKDILKEICIYCREKGLYIQTYHDDMIYTSADSPELQSDLDTKNTQVVEVGDMAEADLPDTPKAVIIAYPQYVQAIVRELSERYSQVCITSSNTMVIEVNPKGVSKAHGLSLVCENLGITKDDVIVFGDYYNDLEMIEWAGCGVAMSNAVPEVKEAADRITTKERSEGVAEVLRDVFSEIL